MFKTLGIVLLLLVGSSAIAQNKMSFDLAGIRNMRQSLNGSNVSCFYHFSERLAGGVELNRFYPATKTEGEEQVKQSAWDFDLNFHYLAHLNKKVVFYPLTGISHTSEKEHISSSSSGITTITSLYNRFWSVNAGAGFLWECGKWAPHIEYSYTWGHINQQFLLAGISYELEWGHHEGHK
jgi:hypothetical protein